MWCRLYSSLLPGYSAKPSRWPNSHGLPAELCGEPGGFWPQHKHWRQNQTRPHPAAVAPVCRVRCPGHCGGSHSPNHSNSDAVVPIPYLTPFSHTPSTSSIRDVHSRTSLCLQAPGLLKGSFLLKNKTQVLYAYGPKSHVTMTLMNFTWLKAIPLSWHFFFLLRATSKNYRSGLSFGF